MAFLRDFDKGKKVYLVLILFMHFPLLTSSVPYFIHQVQGKGREGSIALRKEDGLESFSIYSSTE